MTLLMALSWFLHGGDVDRLGHRDYAVRAAAHRRLQAAGPWAVPALWAGRRNGNQEKAMRIGLILGRRLSAWEGVIWSVMSRKDVTDSQLKLVGEVMALNPVLAAQVYDAIDLSGGFWSRSSETWTRQKPYHTVDLATENTYVLKGVREALLFPTPPQAEVPMVMPPPPPPPTHQ